MTDGVFSIQECFYWSGSVFGIVVMLKNEVLESHILPGWYYMAFKI